MQNDLMLPLVGLSYALIFRFLAWLRREPFSLQFVLEAVGLTALATALSFFAGLRLNPILFVVLLYFLTMRAPLLVDLANLMARSGRFALAERLYDLAGRLWPDEPARLVIAMNHGAALILQDRLLDALSLLEGVLKAPHLSPKHAAAVHYNLGIAYRSHGEAQKSNQHLIAAMEILPGSIYAQHAQAMLKKRPKQEPPSD